MAIVGPGEIAPGETAHFRLIGSYSDGTTRDLTDASQWSVSSSASALVVAVEPGQFTGVQNGYATVLNSFHGWRSSKSIRVLKPGTVEVRGTVVEAAPAVGAIGGALVQAVEDPALSHTTSEGGSFLLYADGHLGALTLKATRDGYATSSRSVPLTSSLVSVAISMERLAPIEDRSGFYKLGLLADPECAQTSSLHPGSFAPLPPDLRIRTYVAEVLQNVNRLKVRVSGVTITAGGQPYTYEYDGRLDPGQMVFGLGYHDGSDGLSDYPQGLIDRISPSSYLLVDGAVSISTDTMTGTLRGALQLAATPSVRQPPIATCVSEQHRI